MVEGHKRLVVFDGCNKIIYTEYNKMEMCANVKYRKVL
jgi:hypothetical protein